MELFIYVALTALAACLLSQIFKNVLNSLLRKEKFEFRHLTADGNYPSSHTAFTTSVTTISWINTIYNLKNGNGAEQQFWASIALTVFLIVVVKDALGVRYTVQKLCDAVAKLADDSQNKDEIKKILDVKSGHRPHEVIAGAVLGLIVASATSVFYYNAYSYIPLVVFSAVLYIVVSLFIVKKKK